MLIWFEQANLLRFSSITAAPSLTISLLRYRSLWRGTVASLKKTQTFQKPNFSANGEFFLQPYNKYIFVLSLNLVVLNLFYFLMTQACIKTLLWIDFCHRPALRYVYMLEFHPSLGLASRVYEALQSALKVCIFSLFL